MSDALKAASATVWAWRLIIFKGFNSWFIVVAMTLFAQDVAWQSMTGFQRTRLVVMALIAGAKAIEAFLNQDLGRAKQEMARALSDENTQHFTRSEVQQTTVQTSVSIPNETKNPTQNA